MPREKRRAKSLKAAVIIRGSKQALEEVIRELEKKRDVRVLYKHIDSRPLWVLTGISPGEGETHGAECRT